MPAMFDLLSLASSRTVILDGAMGTQMQRAGLSAGQCGELWNLDYPERVAAIHADYLDAGCDAIITATFGANRWVLARFGAAAEVEAVNRAAARVARGVARDAACVLGDIGPCGGLLRPLGEIDPADLSAEFTRQARALVAAGVDGIIVETMTDVEELRIAIRAARSAGAPLVIASMAFDRLPNGRIRTMMGASPEQAARAAVEEGADVVGANCGTSMTPADFAEVAGQVRRVTDRPIAIQANAGKPELVDGRAVYTLSAEALADGMAEVVAAGASLVGGCCGTTPGHIAELARRFRRA
jgi:5-methyltetrahydrofolate--homocysteine methyltransferase